MCGSFVDNQDSYPLRHFFFVGILNLDLDTKVNCSNIPILPNGKVTLEGNQVGSLARYQCRGDTELIGNEIRQCLQTGLWSGFDPNCQSE